MKILVTGAAGFVGKNLIENLKNIRDRKNLTRPSLYIEEIYEYDVISGEANLDEFCRDCDFVFNLAGINRPQNAEDFMTGNCDFVSELIDCLKKNHNKAPIMFSSSIQSTLIGRYKDSKYGISKLAGEKILFEYSKECDVKVLVYRFPNLFGKWCRPNYNSVVATFCNNIANDLPIQVNDPETEITLVYIDDLIDEMFDALEGKEHRCEYEGINPKEKSDGRYCYVPTQHQVTLGKIVELLNEFKRQPVNLLMPSISPDSLEKKLYSCYLSYLPESKMMVPIPMSCDERGSFTELIKTFEHGQFSVNVSKPGAVKGEHWHNSKWEIFIVVSGHGLIQERRIGSDEVIEFEVTGDNISAIYMLPGYTHNIINLSDTEDLITLMWANEIFNPEYPETYRELVVSN